MKILGPFAARRLGQAIAFGESTKSNSGVQSQKLDELLPLFSCFSSRWYFRLSLGFVECGKNDWGPFTSTAVGEAGVMKVEPVLPTLGTCQALHFACFCAQHCNFKSNRDLVQIFGIILNVAPRLHYTCFFVHHLEHCSARHFAKTARFEQRNEFNDMEYRLCMAHEKRQNAALCASIHPMLTLSMHQAVATAFCNLLKSSRF